MPSSDSLKGHRKRLREKFVKSGLAGFHDYEIIELLLSLGTPRKDCKQPAKEAIKKFKTLRGVLEASRGIHQPRVLKVGCVVGGKRLCKESR